MAAIGKIRSWGPVLVGVIGLALFAFVAGDLFRGCESSNVATKQKLAVVNGEKINAIDYQRYVEEYTEAMKTEFAMQGRTPSDEEIRQSAWQELLNNKMIEAEAKELGITVTDEEIQNIINQGTNQMLLSIPIPQFHNQQTGRFDANALKQFLASYKQAQQNNPQLAEQLAPIYKYWLFKENQLKQNLLAQKYMVLLQESVLSNPAEAKFAFDAEKQETNVELAYIEYNSINDNDVKVSDQELKAKYDQLKERFFIPQEIREIKYIEVKKVASAADKADLRKKMEQFAEELQTAENPEQVVNKSQSLMKYAGVPVTKNLLPLDVAARLDSIAVGTTTKVTENTQDNTFNIIKLIGKSNLPDSIQYRAISVMAATPAETKTKADSVLTALQNGADFAAIAKKYNQTGEAEWITGAQQFQAVSQSRENKTVFDAMNAMAVNELKNIHLTQGNIILQVLDKKAMKEKYDVAVIKRTIDFSDETSQEIYNKFNQFVASNRNLQDLEKNAPKAGYIVRELPMVTTSAGNIAGIQGTRDALKWTFEAKEGDLSDVFKCGNNDELLVVALTKINPKGHMALSHQQVNSTVKAEVIKDKKAQMIIEKLKGVNSIAAAKQKGCKTTTVEQITFAAPAMVPALMVSEPALSGAATATAKGKFSARPIVGNAAVYLFQVTDKKTLPGKFEQKQYGQKAAMGELQRLFQAIQYELQRKADVTDNRYLFM